MQFVGRFNVDFIRLITALALSCAVIALSQAQTKIYESTDAEGNTVFSDTPSEGAESLEIQPTNIAAPVEPEAPTAAISEGKAAPAGVVVAPQEHSRVIVNGDEEEHRGGDRWRTEHTEDGDILTQEHRGGDRWRTVHTEDGDILTEEPHHEQLEEVIDGEVVPVERVLHSRKPSSVHRGKR
jgi:hypothetical protein